MTPPYWPPHAARERAAWTRSTLAGAIQPRSDPVALCCRAASASSDAAHRAIRVGLPSEYSCRPPPLPLTDLLTRLAGTGETARDADHGRRVHLQVSETRRDAGDGGDVRRMAHNPATAEQTERDPLIGAEPCPGPAAASDDWWLGRGTETVNSSAISAS